MDLASDFFDTFLTNWKKKGGYLLAILLSVGILITQVVTGNERFHRDYLLVKEIFAKWEQGEPLMEEHVVKLKTLLKKHPALSTRYDAVIGQNFLEASAPKEASPFINRTLFRAEQPYFSDYSKTSLKICEGKIEEALREAIDLKERLNRDPIFWEKSKEGSILFPFNLMRIAVLSQQLERWEDELKAWEEIEQYGSDGGEGIERSFAQEGKSEGFKEIFNHFSAQEATLLDYIEIREKELKTLISRL